MAKKKPDPRPAEKPPKPNALVVRGSVEWREWVKELADFDRTTVADEIDRALVDRARQIGFKKVAPKR